MVRHNGQMKEATRQTLIRHSDEPKLEIGDTVLIKEGVVGVVLAGLLNPVQHYGQEWEIAI
jgi:hypothetical protein